MHLSSTRKSTSPSILSDPSMATTGDDPSASLSQKTRNEEMLRRYLESPASEDPYLPLHGRPTDREAHLNELEKKLAEIHAVLGKGSKEGNRKQ